MIDVQPSAAHHLEIDITDNYNQIRGDNKVTFEYDPNGGLIINVSQGEPDTGDDENPNLDGPDPEGKNADEQIATCDDWTNRFTIDEIGRVLDGKNSGDSIVVTVNEDDGTLRGIHTYIFYEGSPFKVDLDKGGNTPVSEEEIRGMLIHTGPDGGEFIVYQTPRSTINVVRAIEPTTEDTQFIVQCLQDLGKEDYIPLVLANAYSISLSTTAGLGQNERAIILYLKDVEKPVRLASYPDGTSEVSNAGLLNHSADYLRAYIQGVREEEQ